MSMHPLGNLAPASRERAVRAFDEECAREAAAPGDGYACRTEEIERYHKDGSTRWAEISMSFLRDDKGKPSGIMAISHDITDRKRMESELREVQDGLEQRVRERTAALSRANEQLMEEIVCRKRAQKEQEHLRAQLYQSRKMEAIGTLAGGIAHDFNNLLTVVIGFSELLLTDNDEQDPSYADLLKINQAAQRGADLVQGLLAFSRETEIKSRPLNLNHQIEQLQELLTRTIPKMIAIKLNLANSLPPVNADPTQMDRVFINLAVNAKDAMPDGGELIIETANVFLDEEYAQTHLDTRPGEYVVLKVSDTGHGMDKGTLDRIFEPFFTTKEASKGTGLGLASVYGIVKQHGGHITCDSEPGEGATFKIYLPVAEQEVDNDLTTSGFMTAFGTATILLVDDEGFILELGQRILSGFGYDVLTAANGREALELYRNRKDEVSLIILDWIMPEMGGSQCLEAIRKIDPKAKVVVASGVLLEETKTEAGRRGARGFIGKPYNRKALLKTVWNVLNEV